MHCYGRRLDAVFRTVAVLKAVRADKYSTPPSAAGGFGRAFCAAFRRGCLVQGAVVVISKAIADDKGIVDDKGIAYDKSIADEPAG